MTTTQDFLQHLHLQKGDILAIDGPCGSGKTTLANCIASEHEVDLIQMDDFYLPLSLRTTERLAEIGGNVHYERFAKEVLAGIQSGKEFAYKRFSCQTMDYTDTVRISNEKPILIEGSYSLRPEFRDIYTTKVYIEVSEDTQKARLIGRVGVERYEDFKNIWIPKEQTYLTHFQIREAADIVLKG